MKAGEVRKRLGLYYSEQGRSDPVRIELPSGTYVPEFRLEPGPPRRPAPDSPPVARARRRTRADRSPGGSRRAVALLAIGGALRDRGCVAAAARRSISSGRRY